MTTRTINHGLVVAIVMALGAVAGCATSSSQNQGAQEVSGTQESRNMPLMQAPL